MAYRQDDEDSCANLPFWEGEVGDETLLDQVFTKHAIDGSGPLRG